MINVISKQPIKMKRTSLIESILYHLGYTCIDYPDKCRICGAKTKGNFIIGYRMGCKEPHTFSE